MVEIRISMHIIIQILVIPTRHAHLQAGFFLALSTTGLPDVYHKTPGNHCTAMVSRGFSLFAEKMCLPNVYQLNFLIPF